MVRKQLYYYFEFIIGMIIVAVAFDLFITPLKIVIGGTNGMAVIIDELFNISPSIFITVFYAFAFILNIIVFGLKKSYNLIIGAILYPLFVELFSNLTSYIVLDYTNNSMLMYIIAAVLIGLGNGLIYKRGYICGGTDVIKKILNEKLKIPMGKCAFIFDTIVVISGGFIFGMTSVLYAIIILYISSKITDVVILGISSKKMFYIMTYKPDEIRECIVKDLKHGVTELNAIGGYTGDKTHILMCVIPTRDYLKLEKKVNEIDKKAFFLITDSYHLYHER